MPKRIIIGQHYNGVNSVRMRIKIAPERPKLPEDVEAIVRKNWEEFKSKKPNAKDNPVAYLISQTVPDQDGIVRAKVFTAGFSYNQFLNRTDTDMVHAATANEAGYNPMASWAAIECDRGATLLFGNKKDYGNKKVSGFGGFTAPDDEVGVVIDVKKWIKRKLKEETGEEVTKRIKYMGNIGLNFYPIVGPKGFDEIFVVEVDGIAENLQAVFKENDQFSKQVIPIKADPKSLVDFLEGTEWEPTTSCIGGVFSYIGSRWGSEELRKAVGSYSGKDDVEILDEPFDGPVKDRILSLS